MNKYILLLILLLYACTIRAQSSVPYVKMEFLEMTEKWQHLCSDSTIIDSEVDSFRTNVTFNGSNHITRDQDFPLEPIIIGNEFISISNTFIDADYCGGLIEKINIETGERIWFSSFDFRTTDYREYILSARIDGNNLLVSTARFITPEPDFPIPLLPIAKIDAVLEQRFYNLDNGELIRHDIADLTDPDILIFTPTDDNKTQIFPIGGDNYQVFQTEVNASGDFVFVDTISNRGVKLNATDTLHSVMPDRDYSLSGWTYDNKILKYSEDEFYRVENFIPVESLDSDSEAKIISYDADNNIKWIYTIKPGGKVEFFPKLREVNENYILIEVCDLDATNTQTLILLDKNGNLVNRVHADIERPHSFQISEMDENGDVFIFASYVQPNFLDNSATTNIYKTTNSSYEFVNTITVKELQYSTIFPYCKLMDNGDYLIRAAYGFRGINRFSYNYNFSHWMRVSPDELFGMTSSVANGDAEVDVILYPNPVTDNIHLELPSSGYLKVSTIQGQVIYESIGRKKSLISVRNWEPGVYVLKFFNDRKILVHAQSFIKI